MQVGDWVTEKKKEKWVKEYFSQLIAEHGFSMQVRVSDGSDSHSILFDTGHSAQGVVSNVSRMGVDLSNVESIVLSHRHYIDFGGLLAVFGVIRKDNLPIIVHEDMFKSRRVAQSGGIIRKCSSLPSEDQVSPAKYARTKQPVLLADNIVLVAGEIRRITDFEKGFLQHRVLFD
jgi:7,8-dihydropterin-6-yl-methyl-4-(beta-D-ribofuranosyl)aminobenzene 5'-phosphate synthase